MTLFDSCNNNYVAEVEKTLELEEVGNVLKKKFLQDYCRFVKKLPKQSLGLNRSGSYFRAILYNF